MKRMVPLAKVIQPRSSMGLGTSLGGVSKYSGNFGSFKPSPDPQSVSPPIFPPYIPASVPAKRASSDSLSETSRAGLSSRMSSSSDSTGLGYGVAKGPRVCGRPGSPPHHSLILPPPTSAALTIFLYSVDTGLGYLNTQRS